MRVMEETTELMKCISMAEDGLNCIIGFTINETMSAEDIETNKHKERIL